MPEQAELPPEMAALAAKIDHTLLKADATADQISAVCQEARQFRFASVCVNGCHVKLVARELAGTGVKACAVVGFPLGAMASRAKAAETRIAVEDGADEIDMVINVGALKEGKRDAVRADIAAVVEAAAGRTVKVILETALLSEGEKVAACEIAREAGAHFVKTSTGFGGGGATVEDIALMRRTVGDAMQVKASGGIRDRATAEAMVAAGADRLGCSASVAIVTGASGKSGY